MGMSLAKTFPITQNEMYSYKSNKLAAPPPDSHHSSCCPDIEGLSDEGAWSRNRWWLCCRRT